MASIKFNLDKEVRRSSYNHTKEDPLTFEKLKNLAIKLFPTIEGKAFDICYRDDENDLVTFSSDEELNEAIKFMLPKSTTLKFTLTLEENTPAAVAVATTTTTTTSGKGSNAKGNKKTTIVLPSVSLSPQEAVAASALINHSATDDLSDSSSEEGQPQTTSAPTRSNNKRNRDSLESNGDGIDEPNAMAVDDENALNTSSASKRRQSYSLQDKLSLLKEYHELNLTNKKPMKQFAIENNINQKTFSSWMKEYQEGKLQNLNLTPDNKRIRLRKAEYPEIENLLIQFIESYDPNQTVSWSLIRTYALKYAKEYLKPEDLPNFKASDGWIQNFLRRNNIVLHRRLKSIGGTPGVTGEDDDDSEK